jgi:capsular exopolysaccharide synthesis family protein
MSRNYQLLQAGNGNHLQKMEANIPPAMTRTTTAQPSDDLDLDMFSLVRMLLRRRFWIYLCTGGLVALAALACILMTPQYRAVSKLQILKQDQGITFGDTLGPAGGGFSDVVDFNLSQETQVSVLKSDTLALQVIRELNLADTREFRYNPLIKNAEVRRQMAAPLDQAPLKVAAILHKFKSNLKVDSVSGTRLITVSYTHPDPAMAAKIVNQLVADFVEHNFQVRYNATSKATEWLRRQLVDLKSQVEKAQQHAVELQKASGIFGEDEHHNIVITKLEQLNNELTTAQANRVIKEAVYNLARNGNPEAMAGLLGSSVPGAAGSAYSLSLLNSLRQQEADLSSQYADAAAKYGPAYPRVIQLQERLASVQSSIQAELNKVVDRARSEYQVAASQEADARARFAQQKAIAAEMNNKAIDYTIAKQEAESSRALYENLQKKLQEAGVLAGLHSSDLNVVDPAVVPDRPSAPNVPLYLAFGALAGMTLGVICAVVAEALDRTVRDPLEIETTTSIPLLGVIPDAKLRGTSRQDRLKAPIWNHLTGAADGNHPHLMSAQDSAVSEAFRSLRTSLLLSPRGQSAKIFMITSSMPQEGKTFSTLNLASVLAQMGGKVLLVDADLRRATLSRALKQRSAAGLSQLLLGTADREVYRQVPEIPGLTFLPAGTMASAKPLFCPPRPSELLACPRMAELIRGWRQEFSYVLIDTPPVLPVTDAVVLSPNVDAVIVVARFAATNRQSIARAIRVLKDAQARCSGILVNAMDVHSPDYYHYCGTYGYDGYHTEASRNSHPLALPSA